MEMIPLEHAIKMALHYYEEALKLAEDMISNARLEGSQRMREELQRQLEAMREELSYSEEKPN